MKRNKDLGRVYATMKERKKSVALVKNIELENIYGMSFPLCIVFENSYQLKYY